MTKRSPAFDLARPNAGVLIEALRSIGYTLETAVADLIDNSITARAKNIWLTFHWDELGSHIAIVDDGIGMSEENLVLAITPGTRSPLDERKPDDLGRFGLGLKTASFSQCRRVTVRSRQRGREPATRCWDLDHVGKVGEWQLLRKPYPDTASKLEGLMPNGHGTVVLWENLDRFLGSGPKRLMTHGAFLRAVDFVRDHLGMVFQRFLESGLRIFVNGEAEPSLVRPWDPFLQGRSTATPRQTLGETSIKGFILPHKDKLSDADYEIAAGPAGWNAQQGFYVYRNNRLLVAGGWLNLNYAREEHYKLARISIDIPNSVDADWDIDVKKSKARPPADLTDGLRTIANNVRNQARQVYAHRGRALVTPKSPVIHPWRSDQLVHKVAYRIRRDHPAVEAALKTASKPELLEAVLILLEETVPVQTIWLDASERPDDAHLPFETIESDIKPVLKALFAGLKASGMSTESAIAQLARMEPFDRYPDLVGSLKT